MIVVSSNIDVAAAAVITGYFSCFYHHCFCCPTFVASTTAHFTVHIIFIARCFSFFNYFILFLRVLCYLNKYFYLIFLMMHFEPLDNFTCWILNLLNFTVSAFIFLFCFCVIIVNVIFYCCHCCCLTVKILTKMTK